MTHCIKLVQIVNKLGVALLKLEGLKRSYPSHSRIKSFYDIINSINPSNLNLSLNISITNEHIRNNTEAIGTVNKVNSFWKYLKSSNSVNFFSCQYKYRKRRPGKKKMANVER
jgi:hypothetical protein